MGKLKNWQRWTKEEEAILKEYGVYMSPKDIQRQFMPYRSSRSIQAKCTLLDIRNSSYMPHRKIKKFRDDEREEFCCLYYKLTNDELARHYDIHVTTVDRQARKWQVRKSQRYKDIDQEFTQEQKEIIEGTLLGDGTLSKIREKLNSKLCLKHGLPQEEYIKWKYNKLKPFSTNLKYSQHFSPLSKNGEIIGRNLLKPLTSIHFQTISHPYLKELEKKWYLRDDHGNYILKNGIRTKIIPKDLVLTPLSLALWYFDDGTHNLCYSKDRNFYLYKCVLFTLSFTKNECEFLCELIRKLDIESYVRLRSNRNNQYEICIRLSSYKKFIDTIAPYLPHESLYYKIDLKGYLFNKDKKENRFLPFEEARAFTCKLGISNFKDWEKYAFSQLRPSNIPCGPHLTYKNEWKGYDYWLGNEYQSFTQARSYARNLHLPNRDSWFNHCASRGKPDNIPKRPESAYKDEWQGWADWLGK